MPPVWGWWRSPVAAWTSGRASWPMRRWWRRCARWPACWVRLSWSGYWGAPGRSWHGWCRNLARGVEPGRAARTLYLRRYCAKFAYELELHDQPPELPPLAARYAELLSAGLRVEWSGESYLADVDPGFYSSCYLRAWALETHLRRHLVDRFGPRWFASAAAGALLSSLWAQGQRQTPDELLGELTGEQLDLRVLLDDLALV